MDILQNKTNWRHFRGKTIWGPPQYKDAVLPAYDYHYKDKTVSRPSYLYNGNPHTWKDGRDRAQVTDL